MKKGWEMKTIGDVCGKGSSNVSQNKLDNEEGDYPIFGASGFIKNVSFYHQAKPYLSIVKDGSGYGRVTKMDAFTSVIGTLQYIIPNDNVDLDYLYYSLISVDFKKYVAGAAIPHIYFKDYKNEPFLWMPLQEQRKIVSILDEAFAAIDQAKENVKRNMQNAKELFQSELNSIFANEEEEWEEKTVQELSKVISGYSFKSGDFSETNTVKSVKITNVGVKEFVEEEGNYLPEDFGSAYSNFSVSEGNIVIALTRTIISSGLKVAVVPESYHGALLNQRVAALIPYEHIVNQRFLYNFLCTEIVAKYVRAHVNTLMQPNLSINDLKKLPVPCPGLGVQNLIVNKLDKLSSEVERLLQLYTQKSNSLEELKKSILQKAFNGELTETRELEYALERST